LLVVRIALALALVFVLGCQSSDVSRRLGAACTMNSDCDSRCLGPGAGWPNGFCTVPCDTDAACGDNARCIAETGGVCAFPCAANADCTFLGAGYTCQQVDARSGGKVMVCHGG
jgi:hypothetical protein